MKEIEILTLQKMLLHLKLKRAEQEYGNKYVFGFDDVERTFGETLYNLQHNK